MWASARKWGAGPCPAQCIWQGSGFAADQTNAMLAVVRADDKSLAVVRADDKSLAVVRVDDKSLVPPQAARLALSVARPLPAETASLGFGGSPVGGGDKKLPFCIFFGVPAWGWYHYPRRTLHAVETLDACGSRRRIRRFYAASEFAPCGQNTYPQRVLSPARRSERTRRLTRANTERFRRLRHRQGR